MCNNSSGCRIGCTFCASTLGGLKRNLEAGEIVAQVVEVQHALDEKEERVSSVVVMGIGEPFDNYDELMTFLRIVNHEKGIEYWCKTYYSFNKWNCSKNL